MPTFLSRAWLDAHAAAGASLPERPGATAVVQHVVTGGPDGEARYHLAWVDGRVVAAVLGPAEAPDLVCTAPYADAAAMASGAVGAHEAFMQGKLKVVGSTGRLMDLMPVLDSDEHRALLVGLSDDLDA